MLFIVKDSLLSHTRNLDLRMPLKTSYESIAASCGYAAQTNKLSGPPAAKNLQHWNVGF